jgi:hypothetical protein
VLGRRAYAASTTADILNGHRKNPVSWTFVHYFVSACVAHAQAYGIELDAVDRDMRAWWSRWITQADPEHREFGGSSPANGPAIMAAVS